MWVDLRVESSRTGCWRRDLWRGGRGNPRWTWWVRGWGRRTRCRDGRREGRGRSTQGERCPWQSSGRPSGGRRSLGRWRGPGGRRRQGQSAERDLEIRKPGRRQRGSRYLDPRRWATLYLGHRSLRTLYLRHQKEGTQCLGLRRWVWWTEDLGPSEEQCLVRHLERR